MARAILFVRYGEILYKKYVKNIVQGGLKKWIFVFFGTLKFIFLWVIYAWKGNLWSTRISAVDRISGWGILIFFQNFMKKHKETLVIKITIFWLREGSDMILLRKSLEDKILIKSE